VPGSYSPYGPARRPGGKPAAAPEYRVLVHRKFAAQWDELVGRVGVRSAQQFWDHVAYTPGQPPVVNSACKLRGKAAKPKATGFSSTYHYEISGAGRIDYQYNGEYVGERGDPHGVVWILTVDLGSH